VLWIFRGFIVWVITYFLYWHSVQCSTCHEDRYSKTWKEIGCVLLLTSTLKNSSVVSLFYFYSIYFSYGGVLGCCFLFNFFILIVSVHTLCFIVLTFIFQAYMFKYDSTHGPFKGTIKVLDDTTLEINGKQVKVVSKRYQKLRPDNWN